MIPAPVRIVRPRRTTRQDVMHLFDTVVALLIRSWLVMLLAPLAGFTPGYWQTVGLLYAVGLVINRDSYLLWTARE